MGYKINKATKNSFLSENIGPVVVKNVVYIYLMEYAVPLRVPIRSTICSLKATEQNPSDAYY